MMNVQKLIKYCAMGFAIFLIVIIVGSIASGLLFALSFTNDYEYDYKTLDEVTISQNIEELEVNIGAIELEVKVGDKLKVETNNKYIKVKDNGTRLSIKETSHKLFNRDTAKLTIYVPKDYKFREVDIDTGAGKVSVDELNASELSLDLGAGRVQLDNINITNQTDIDAGAGKTIITNSSLNNLDLDAGVGKVEIIAYILGDSVIDAGVGAVDVVLLGNKDDYKIKVDKGIGSFKVDGDSISDNTYYGKGKNSIDVNGGVGSISVSFKNQNKIDASKKFVRTYKVLSKTPAEVENKYYVTLQVFQGEVDTVLVEDKNNILRVDGTYEFTFEKIDDIDEDKIDEIFDNCSVISIEETTKVGLEQTQESI